MSTNNTIKKNAIVTSNAKTHIISIVVSILLITLLYHLSYGQCARASNLVTQPFYFNFGFINMDVMCCADIGHIFSLVIDVNDKEVISDTSTKTYVDAMVPVPDRWAQTSLLNSCFFILILASLIIMFAVFSVASPSLW
jgi:hypothetical protein